MIYTDLERQILALINEHRRGKGLPELQWEDGIQESCRAHTLDMASGRLPLGHEGFRERGERLLRALGGKGIAENVAEGQADAQSVVRAWLDSPGHRKNIEGDYTHTGITAERDAQGKLYYTQIFMRLAARNTPAQTPPVTDADEQALSLETRLLELLQAHRRSLGMPPFRMNEEIRKAARAHSRAMASGGLPFGHEGFQERAGRLLEMLNSRSAGENIAQGSDDPQSIADFWLGSEAHRRNVEGNFGHTGIGAARNAQGQWFFTQMFIR